MFSFYLFLCFVLLIIPCFSSFSVHHLCSPSEASALLQFKQSFIISKYHQCWIDPFNRLPMDYPKTTSWNESRDCCMWDGVTCDMLTGHVIGLDLSCSQLVGSIHPNSSLFQLHHLRTLNLAYNDFSYSSIPNDIGRLTNLRHLNLSTSHVSGKIPTEISHLSNLISLDLSSSVYLYGLQLDQKTFETMLHNFTNLEVLSLSSVNISSPIPLNISSSSLRYVNLHHTNLRGFLTESFFLMPNLENLKLGWNNLLKGVLPKLHPSNTLLELDISFTEISGELHDYIGTFSSLNRLNLHGCQFFGSIPDSIGNLTQIRELHLGGNHFTGHIPSSILSLTHLQILSLAGNSLSGPLPNNASMLRNLTYVNLSFNSLHGTIPSWVFSLPLLSSVSLHYNRLTGSFPQSPVNLTNLFTLDLSSNNITLDAGIQITLPSLEVLQLSSCELKDFPHFLRNVKTLQVLDISNNKIRGQIPDWFSGMRWDNLWYLNISHNSLTGHLPQFHYYNLEYLDLKFNSLQGPLPSSTCNIGTLEFLVLSCNNFSNSIPSCLGIMANLTVLDLRRNNFTGRLPPLCAQSNSLRTIVLNGNRLEGPVPMSLFKCDGLEVLDMGNNAINDTFPAWLGTLQVLQVLILKSNKFHGPIITGQKFGFPMLRIFDLSHNEFSGSLPAEIFQNFKAMIKLAKGEVEYMEPLPQRFVIDSTYSLIEGQITVEEIVSNDVYEDSVGLVIKGNDMELEKISTIMTAIDLSSNHFEGVIPKALMDLGSLWLLNLSHNNLEGDIPMEMGQLKMLEALDLSWNRLTGKIPQELTRLTFLEKLNLSQNLLVGRIPQGSQFNTFENDSYGGNLDLCGPLLSKQCDPSHLPQPLEYEEEEEESYFFSGFTWESVVIGYSFGFIVGTVMWSLMFKYRKPKWLVEIFESIFPKKMRRPKKRAQRRRT